MLDDLPERWRQALVWVRARVRRATGRALTLRLPFDSLPSRIVAVAVSTALVTSLAVTWISTRSTESFLRREIDDRFPAMLDAGRERIDLWYGQRILDLATFADSDTLVEHAPVLVARRPGRRLERAEREVKQYLAYVLDHFPQYRALFLLDRQGQKVVWVGEEAKLSSGRMERLRRTEEARVSALQAVAGRRIQTVSARVAGAEGEATLHALVQTEHLDALLADDGLSGSGRIAAVDADGTVLAPLGVSADALPEVRGPRAAASPRVAEYVLADGERVIGSRLELDRFGWTLWVVEPWEAAFAPVVSVVRRVWAINLAIVLVFGAASLWLARSVVRPVHDLSEAARRIAAGDATVEIPVTQARDEIGVLSRALREMTERLGEKGNELQQANEVLLQLAITDELTRLLNHRAFHDRLGRELRRARRTGDPLCLVLIDVDDFKKLNDAHGHATGDEVLREVARRMTVAVRDTDCLARYGGEEFALIAPDTDLEGAHVVAEKVRAEISRAPVTTANGRAIAVTASLGVALYHGDDDALFSETDAALYAAKQSGKDCVVCAGQTG